MHKRCMLNRGGVIGASLMLLGWVGGCSTNTEMNGVTVPNATPDTRVTGQPPTLLEASYAVEFRWTGSDPDGRLKGFQWKLSDNGTDGISPQDTLSVDPLTGAELHPWRFTAATDSTFFVLADQSDFPGDTVAPRSFRSHSLFVRAVDENGAVDPTPAYISFTSVTLVPTSRVEFPNLGGISAFSVPRTVNIGWSGQDPDFEMRTPTKVRFLWIPARAPAGGWISSRYTYNQHYNEILSYDDPRWSQWLPYLSEEEDRVVSIPQQPVGEYFLFATQVQDTAGAVSVGFGYQVEVANLVVREGEVAPRVVLTETFLEVQESPERADDIASGQPLNFSWTADASDYNGNIVSMRHGWDVIDVEDANDPGWAVPPGLSEQNRRATERSFTEGLHTFVVRVEDDSRQVKVLKRTLRVIPFVDRDLQLPLLVLDQHYDRNSSSWPSRDGRRFLNDQLYRNAYWHFLAEGVGGVADFDWSRDRRDHSVDVGYEDLVGYKSVLCYARVDASQSMFGEFRPAGRVDRYVWLTPYQQQGGNVFLVGASSMESFLEMRPDYMIPIVFDTREETYLIYGTAYFAGFGTITLPNGTVATRGPRMYPYATVGIAALDWTAPTGKLIYGRPNYASADRSRLCAGLKGLVLNEAFKSQHLIGPGVIPDTMFTDLEIDWRDDAASVVDTLNLLDQQAYVWDSDEFVDANPGTARTTVITPQPCDGDTYANFNVPNGMCIEPMFNGIARIDWMREVQESRGRTDWPQSRYDDDQLDAGCGPLALTEWEGRERSSARTNGRVFGYASYKAIVNKPYAAADVYWGFDPYRFDHVGTKKAIRWVLSYFGLQINQ